MTDEQKQQVTELFTNVDNIGVSKYILAVIDDEGYVSVKFHKALKIPELLTISKVIEVKATTAMKEGNT